MSREILELRVNDIIIYVWIFFRKLETLRKTIQTQTIIQIYQNIEHYWIKIYRCISIVGVIEARLFTIFLEKKKNENCGLKRNVIILVWSYSVFSQLFHRFFSFFSLKFPQIILHFRKKKWKWWPWGDHSYTIVCYSSVFTLISLLFF